jgi:hypothetical protein
MVWSPATSTAAALVIGVEGLQLPKHRSWTVIYVAAGFLILNGIYGYFQNRSRSHRLLACREEISRKLTSLIASMGELSADNYKMWKTDLYLGRWSATFSKTFPWLLSKSLRRTSSSLLIETIRFNDATSRQKNGVIGRAYAESRDVLWINPELPIPAPSFLGDLDNSSDADLIRTCGILRLIPVMDGLDSHCVGVLAVHMERSFAESLVGTISSDSCSRILNDFAKDLHHLLDIQEM